ncbi:MAG: transglutaminase-like domain-containing protein [Verrucomicrobiota bacterium]
MKRRIIIAAIVLFWLVMTGWLVFFEAFPGAFARALPGYRGIFPSGPVILDSWMRILFQDKAIGYSHTRVDTDEKNPNAQYALINRTVLNLNILGESQNIVVDAEAALDALYNLQKFSFAMNSRRYTARVEGRRIGKKRFLVRIVTDAGPRSVRVDIPDDVILYSPLVEMSLGRLKPGQQLRVRTLEPLSLTTADVVVRAVGRERRVFQGQEKEATVLVMDFQGMEARAWMDADGKILRQETPFGWTMEACTPNQAMALETVPGGTAGDVLRAMMVPCKGTIADPRLCKELSLRLRGLALPPAQLESARQTVRLVKDSEVDVVLSAGRVPPRGAAPSPLSKEIRAYLAPSPFIQSDDPDMIKQARAIGDWVYRRVNKRPTVSLPSARDVLRVMEGDCNEHTYLFVALARAIGIPAQIRIGLLYGENGFYYHAWPAVYVGEWWELDPTLGQEAVDATHVALLEGELANQLKLLGLIGKLGAEVTSQAY